VTGVLARFGFAEISHTTGLARALEEVARGGCDLLIIPVEVALREDAAGLERAIRAAKDTFVIGTAASADPELILRAMRTGVHEFLVSPPDANELGAAVDRLLRRHPTEAQRGKVFAVYSGKGGMGTTTVAVNLAHALARGHTHARVVLADLVVASGDVRVFLNLSPPYDLSSMVEKLDRMDADLLSSLLTQWGDGVWVLPGAENPELDEVLDASVTNAIIEHMRGNFAFTVLDCEHHLNERTLAALDAADRILLVTQLTIAALRNTQRSLALCRRLGYEQEKLCVVINRHESGEMLSPSDAAELLKHEVYWKLPNDYRVAAGAPTRGVPVATFDSGSKLSASFAQLAAKLGGGSRGAAARNGAHGAGRPGLRRLLGLGKRG
jgi:pilus assembly protein CpaE